MVDYNEFFQSADWKMEKHAPVIEVKSKDPVLVEVSVGKEIEHPNTVEHHIRWIQLFFHPEGEKFPYEIGKVEFNTHGESVQGPDTSTIYTEPHGSFVVKTEKKGSLIAFSFCNIHGLWRNEKNLSL